MRRQTETTPARNSDAFAASAWQDIHDLRVSLVADLRTRADHYRRLADMMFDQRIVGIVRDCARELEREADVIESHGRNSSERPQVFRQH